MNDSHVLLLTLAELFVFFFSFCAFGARLIPWKFRLSTTIPYFGMRPFGSRPKDAAAQDSAGCPKSVSVCGFEWKSISAFHLLSIFAQHFCAENMAMRALHIIMNGPIRPNECKWVIYAACSLAQMISEALEAERQRQIMEASTPQRTVLLGVDVLGL